jgi:hypothetical protein
VPQVNDLYRVWMTALRAERVIMVAPVRCHGRARCYLGHLRSAWYLIHGPPPRPHPFAGCSQRLNRPRRDGGALSL